MRVIQVQERFGTENLARAERPIPRPGPGQVLLRMGAASVNYRDWLTVAGRYNPKQTLPLIPCSDGVGEVVDLGAGARRFAKGDRAIPIFAQGWISGEPTREKLRSTLGGPLDGTLAEHVAVDESSVVRAPEHLSDEEAATLPCAGVTAWSALFTHGGLRSGDTVLIQGTGGVSIFALQFARMAGARAIVTSSSDLKLERAGELGAWKTLNYRETPRWGREVAELTGGRGVDVVVEVGGAGTLAQSLEAVRFGGRICQIGILAGASAEVNIVPLLMNQIRLQGVLVGSREDFEAMNRAIEATRLRPVVDRVFPMEGARAALEHLAEGNHFGKLCIRIRD